MIFHAPSGISGASQGAGGETPAPGGSTVPSKRSSLTGDMAKQRYDRRLTTILIRKACLDHLACLGTAERITRDQIERRREQSALKRDQR